MIKGAAARSNDQYYAAVPVASPIMSPEGTPSAGASGFDEKNVALVGSPIDFEKKNRLRKEIELEDDHILRISTVAFSSDFNANQTPSPDFDGKNFSDSSLEPQRRRSNGWRRCLARFFASSVWRKKANHFIPIMLLIVYSATGGFLFWALEGRGRKEAFDRRRFERDRLVEFDRNNTIDLLINLTESMHSDHVAQRLADYDYSRLDRLLYNFSVFENFTIMDTNFSIINSSSIFQNITNAVSDLNALIKLISDALNDTFFAAGDSISAIDSILLNFTNTIGPPLDETDSQDWTFWTSMFYAGTIYTTVGYGYVTAKSNLGRAATMAYALFGIPLVLYTLNMLGRILVNGIWKCYLFCWQMRNCCCPVRYRIRKTKKVVAEFPFAVALIITVAWMMMCSAIFCTLEDWPYFTSFYFFFQSLTTIGFGDVKPKNPEYLVGSFLLILIGLALFSMCWSLLQLKFDHLINTATQRITQKFVHTELEGGRMTTDNPTIQNEIEKIAAGENAWLAAFLDENRRRVLMNEWRHRAKMSNKYVQTEIGRVDRAVQNVTVNKETCSQTPQYMSPEHQYRAKEIPYREIRAGGQPVHNDEFRAMLHGLRNIIGECRDTLSNKDLTAVAAASTTALGASPSHGFRANRSGSGVRKSPSKMSRTSTAGSISMLEL